MEKYRSLGAMVGAIILINSAPVFAQAPVVNLNDQGLAEKVANLERVVNSRTRSQQRVQEQITELQDELSQIRGKIEEQNFQIEKILQRQRELLLAFDVQSQTLQEQADELTVQRPIAATSTPVVQDTPAAASTVSPVGVEGEEAAYKAAVNLILQQRNTAAAVPALEAFAVEYPNSRFKPNAHYWLGQIFYNEKSWEKAKLHFATLIEKYPESNKVPDVTMKLGIIEKNQGNVSQARAYLNQVIQSYPDTTFAKMSQEQLNLL
ncbi:tol-pal system protein YbgF [Alteromonas sp. LMIT006]|uniref:tol-pal system protein YbgF n=1 Tax=Alteromonadaceae TaxID=72275 RepID=UPI0020CA46C9|nr:tol-pal system protein YbgF [Alteromonas sp. LMIT006]UTP72553.1 tol-pal system protein YbgF [Alteromonas sp. LMIT006]